jgi:hypothetical protein
MRIVVLLAIGLVHCTAAWAQFLPPAEFDHPYKGPVAIQHARSQDEVRESCRGMKFNLGIALGCSMVVAGTCLIVKVPDAEIRAHGHDPEVFMRHETGHCNGWPASHVGAR